MKLSVITINYNNSEGLKKTIDSVINQTFRDFEYILIDGGSEDGSKEIILQHEAQFSYWRSEKDHGIYNAMNKGILAAKGDYLLFLNSGDCLTSNDILEQVFATPLKEDIVYGNLLFESQDGNHTLGIYPDELNVYNVLEGSLPHPASFIKRQLFDNSLYTESYRIVSDWEFWIKKIIMEGVSYKHISLTISRFDTTGISSNSQRCNEERELVLQRLFPRMIYSELMSWYEIKSQPCFPLFKEISKTKKFQRRIQPLIRTMLKIHLFFTREKKAP